MGEMLRWPAHLPDALIGLVPDRCQMPEHGLADCRAASDRGQTAQMGVVERVENLAIDVELGLVCRTVADAYRPRALIARQPGDLPLAQPALTAQPVHDLDLVGAAGDGAKQPVAPRPRLV